MNTYADIQNLKKMGRKKKTDRPTRKNAAPKEQTKTDSKSTLFPATTSTKAPTIKTFGGKETLIPHPDETEHGDDGPEEGNQDGTCRQHRQGDDVAPPVLLLFGLAGPPGKPDRHPHRQYLPWCSLKGGGTNRRTCQQLTWLQPLCTRFVELYHAHV